MTDKEYNYYLNIAKQNITKYVSGKKFRAKDMFRGTQWDSLKKGDRISFGTRFKADIIAGVFPNVTYLGKDPNNSATYIKK